MSGWPTHTPDTENGNAPWPVALASEPNPTPTPDAAPVAAVASKRMRLETVKDVRRELKRLYLAARNGELKVEQATRLAYLLDLMARMIERSDMERRIEELEAGKE